MRGRTVTLGIVVALTILAAALGWATYPWRTLNPDFMFRFFALSERYTLSKAEQEAAVDIVRQAIATYGTPETPGDAPRDLPDRFTLRDPRPVWVNLYLPTLPGTRGMGQEANLYRSLRAATRQALNRAKDRSTWLQRRKDIRIQVDILQDRAPLRFTRDWYLFFAVEPGVDGLILTKGDKVGYQLPSDAVTKGYLTPRVRGRVKCVEKLLAKTAASMHTRRNIWKEPDTRIEKFRTISFGVPVPGKGVVSFYRGNVLLNLEEVTARRIYQAIEEGADWLLRNARPDGRFNYQYMPNTDTYSKAYNAVRHAGTVYGLLELYRQFQKPSFLEAARRAAPYLYEHIGAPEPGSDLLAIPDGRAWPTGAAALGLLAFINMPPEMRTADYATYEDGLARFLLLMIDDRGQVFQGYLAYKGAKEVNGVKRVKKEPLYYPGESMLALSKYYEQTHDKRWLDAAMHIADWQIRRFNLGRMADHWVIQGLYQIYRHTGDRWYAEAALEMADSYIDTQCPPNTPPFPDYFGAYRRQNETPRTTRAGSRSEAMTAAVRTAWAIGADARPYEDSLLFAAKHQIEQQFRPENSFFLPRPDRALGGFRAGLVDNQLRIDFNQHSCVGLIGALEVAVKREGIEPWWHELPIEPQGAASETPGPPGTREAPASSR